MANKTKPQVLDAFKQTKGEIANLMGWIGCELGKHDEDNVNWGTVGSFNHVRQNLIETLMFLSGIDEAAIKRSLTELDS